jgi:short-subunit dehydrogenase
VSGLTLRGSVAVVTGASSGIGAATAVDFARRGALVVAVARRAERLAATVEQCRAAGGTALAVTLDVTEAGAVEAIASTASRFGEVDVLVHNAGTGLHRSIMQTGPEDVRDLLEVHLMAPIKLTRAFLPGMLSRRRGAVVTVGSISAVLPAPGEASYGAAKAALTRWTHGLATELAGTGVRAAVVSPGPIDTEIWEHVGRHYRGRLFPAESVSAAIVRSVERGGVQHYVPRRFAVVAAAYPVAGAAMRVGVRAYARVSGQRPGEVR